MRKKAAISMGLGVLLVVLSSFGLTWGQPTTLIVVRGTDNNLYKMTCDESTCSGFVPVLGRLRDTPSLSWDETAQEWVIVGVNDNNDIFMGTFNANGNFNNDWQQLHGRTPVGAGLSTRGSRGVPIGAVIDWWRPDATFPVPSGFKICDGTVVNDAESPFNGKTVPNLDFRFVAGVTNPINIGAVGGSLTHVHNTEINHDHSTGSTSTAPNHNHVWAYETGGNWNSYNSSGAIAEMINWGDGLDNEGSGIYPVGSNSANSGYWFTELWGSHSHTVDLPALGATSRSSSATSSIPPYYGLLKIMRIK